MNKLRSEKIAPILAAALALGFAGNAGAQMGTPTAAGPGGNPHAVSLYNLGLTAYKQGSPESAVIFFKRACDIDPNLADAQYNLGVIYQSEKRLKEAVPRFQEVLRVRPSDADAHYQLGLCFIDLGQLSDARTSLAGIPPNDKHYPDAQKRISMIDGQGGQPTQPVQQVQPVQQSTQPAYDPNAYQPQQPAQPALQQPAQQPVVQQPPQAVTQPPAVAVATVPAKAAAPAGPVAIMANTQVRVIATGFNAPAGLAFDRLGNLYIANFTSNTIDRINVDGTKSTFSTGSNLKGPIGVAVDPNGNVYVANYNGGTVAKINPAGVSTVIATGFRKPYYLTMDKENNLYVSQQEDNSIVRITLPRPIGARP